ncbi:MAG: hypothetical protein LBI17_03025 [Rickettsiales bacterium]|jgi:hypothetical protein|nr:hypothetical protein [Rickettsiales bacterium]
MADEKKNEKKKDNSLLGVLSTIGKGLLMIFSFCLVLVAFGAGIGASAAAKTNMYNAASANLGGMSDAGKAMATGLGTAIVVHQTAKSLDPDGGK